MKGFLRKDGRKGIRNRLLVVSLVECASFVAKRIVETCDFPDVELIGFSGCAPNDYALHLLEKLCTHSNVGGVLLVSLGCENMDREFLYKKILDSGRPVRLLVIQENGGTNKSVAIGKKMIEEVKNGMNYDSVDFDFSDLIIGTICGGSDATSGLTANPVIGMTFDNLLDRGATCIFEEPGELVGCEYFLADRAMDKNLKKNIIRTINKAEHYYDVMGHDSFSAGNAEGGITTIEEKSLGSYSKSGTHAIDGILYPGINPPQAGLYLLDVIPDGPVKWGFPNINDNSEIMELIACGVHLILFSTGRGTVVGSAISPVLKVCANPITYKNMSDDMDIDCGGIITKTEQFQDVCQNLLSYIEQVCAGKQTCSERLGHKEFYIGYKKFDMKC